MNTKENNKLLAEFMGLNEIVLNDGVTFKDSNTNNLHEIKYHSDWNWLMLVVEKIERLGYIVEIKINWCRIKDNVRTLSLRWEADATKIEAVYNACIEFIEWHKEQNNKQGNG